MQRQREAPPAILCLIDGYPGSIHEGREGSGMTEGMKQKLALLDRHPGRWALVHATTYRNGNADVVGTKPAHFAKHGCEVATVNGMSYARRPHPSGLPLEAYVTRRQPLNEPLPAVRSSYGWTPAELSTALATARAWLFPTEGIQAA